MRRALLAILFLFPSALLFAQAPQFSSSGVVNAATFLPGAPLAPGSLVSIFGTNLSARTASADSVPLATAMGGVTVRFSSGGQTVSAPLLYVQSDDPSKQVTSQINLQVPWNVLSGGTTGTVNVTVTRDGVASQSVPVTIAPTSPGIFTSGSRAVVTNADGSLAWPVNAVPGAATRPAKPGDVIIIYATGLGPVDSSVANGANSLDKLRRTLETPVVIIGGVSAQVLFSGLSPQFVGVNQINAVVPNISPSDTVPVQIQVGGRTSPTGFAMAVGQ